MLKILTLFFCLLSLKCLSQKKSINSINLDSIIFLNYGDSIKNKKYSFCYFKDSNKVLNNKILFFNDYNSFKVLFSIKKSRLKTCKNQNKVIINTEDLKVPMQQKIKVFLKINKSLLFCFYDKTFYRLETSFQEIASDTQHTVSKLFYIIKE